MSQQINLYNLAFEPQKNYATTPVVLGVVLTTLLVLGVFTALAKSQLSETMALAQKVQAELDARVASKTAATAAFVAPRKSETLQQEVDQASSTLANLQKVAGLLEQGHSGAVQGYSPYFRALARRTSEGLWLTGVQILANGDSIGLQGRALKPGLLPPYLAGLSGEPVLRGKKFAQLDLHEPASSASASAAASMAAGAVQASASAAVPRFIEFSLQSTADVASSKAVQP
ncbi:MSHA biogenesis protein MshI [Pseudoduganella danionis]|uniref:MSHA biogenesis protein MshI n=1 Tax=Pseudoduganella danionis TaxID=1890295 RepID=A0ABW9SM78_9BURK|nr:MSHA biogenesis protein MshI [Pseudoduganella danionis]MTW32719.1 MSHA biogenesis protein MshI [Pseudoduganella danionis]